MGLLILIVTGAAIGWLAAVIADATGSGPAISNVFAGAAGSLVVGTATNGSGILGGLSPIALLAGAIGSLIVLAAYRHVRKAQTS